MTRIQEIPGYDYGSPAVAKSPITVQELELLKQSAGFTAEDAHWLRRAGDLLADHTADIVEAWRKVISSHPHLARYSMKPDGSKDPHYSEASGARFQQWIIDTCTRPYDQDWLNYQQEIALRHTSLKKNATDGVDSAPYIRLRDVIAFTAVINDPAILKRYLGEDATVVDRMYQAWCKSVILQVALWAQPYTDTSLAPNEW
jgi:hypothetical protein